MKPHPVPRWILEFHMSCEDEDICRVTDRALGVARETHTPKDPDTDEHTGEPNIFWGLYPRRMTPSDLLCQDEKRREKLRSSPIRGLESLVDDVGPWLDEDEPSWWDDETELWEAWHLREKDLPYDHIGKNHPELSP